ncbi:unnamed protein product [Oreochromis niloticus]|nr:unnamed protein product [Mustela putorius furo]
MMRLPFSVLLVFISQAFGDLIQASVGDDVKFPLSEECMEGHGALNLHLKDGSIQVVASLHGDWEPGRAYIGRVTVSSDSLILTSVDFNDQGMYDFTCKKKGKVELTDLQVFLPSEVVVDEGEDAALPCRSITAGQRVKSAQWRRDREMVLGLNPPHVTDGNDFESRVSIPSDWYQRGDLSLTIKRVQLRDRGVYFCDVDKTERHRSAVRLRVRETVSKSLTSTLKPTLMPTQTTSEVSGLGTLAAVCITAVVFLVLGLVWGWLLKSHCSTYVSRLLRRFGPGDERHDVNGASDPLSHPPPLQMNGRKPSNASQADV